MTAIRDAILVGILSVVSLLLPGVMYAVDAPLWTWLLLIVALPVLAAGSAAWLAHTDPGLRRAELFVQDDRCDWACLHCISGHGSAPDATTAATAALTHWRSAHSGRAHLTTGRTTR